MNRRKQNKCATTGCHHSVSGAVVYCATCRCRQARQRDPVRYAFNNVRNRAKQRTFKKTGAKGIPFTITLAEFRKWCVKVKYIQSKGRTLGSFDLDRKDELEGYHIWNIQKLDKLKNIQKHLEWVAPNTFKVRGPYKPTPEDDDEDLPF